MSKVSIYSTINKEITKSIEKYNINDNIKFQKNNDTDSYLIEGTFGSWHESKNVHSIIIKDLHFLTNGKIEKFGSVSIKATLLQQDKKNEILKKYTITEFKTINEETKHNEKTGKKISIEKTLLENKILILNALYYYLLSISIYNKKQKEGNIEDNEGNKKVTPSKYKIAISCNNASAPQILIHLLEKLEYEITIIYNSIAPSQLAYMLKMEDKTHTYSSSDHSIIIDGKEIDVIQGELSNKQWQEYEIDTLLECVKLEDNIIQNYIQSGAKSAIVFYGVTNNIPRGSKTTKIDLYINQNEFIDKSNEISINLEKTAPCKKTNIQKEIIKYEMTLNSTDKNVVYSNILEILSLLTHFRSK